MCFSQVALASPPSRPRHRDVRSLLCRFVVLLLRAFAPHRSFPFQSSCLEPPWTHPRLFRKEFSLIGWSLRGEAGFTKASARYFRCRFCISHAAEGPRRGFRPPTSHPWGPWDPTLAICPPCGRHSATAERHPRQHAEKTCVLIASRYQRVRFLQGADSAYI